MALDDLAVAIVRSEADRTDRSVTAMIRGLPRRGSVEGVHFELKQGFTPGPREWAELCRDIAAFANSGGGVILLGVGDDCSRLGLAASLSELLDSAKIIDQLRRKAPGAAIVTSYREVKYYGKHFGALIVAPLVTPLIFDTEWGYNAIDGSHKLVIRPGVLYVRTPGKSAPARQADVREIWQRSVDLAAQKTLARIERVASLPPDADLIVAPQGATDEGFVLVSGHKGRPVRIVDDPTAPAVRLREVLSTDAPYSSVDGEVASQVRHWQQADHAHRVSKEALLRWWFKRDDLDLTDEAAAFCLLSACYGHGYPMYWASAMTEDALLQLLMRELDLGRAVPCQSYPYIVAVFFWDRRREILTPHVDRLSTAPRKAAMKVIGASDYEEFHVSSRWNARLSLDGDRISLRVLFHDRSAARRVFSELMQRELDGTATTSETGFAKQLDMIVNGAHVLAA
jgi:hypothetical protein